MLFRPLQKQRKVLVLQILPSLLTILMEEVHIIEHASLVRPFQVSRRAVDMLHAVLLQEAGELVVVAIDRVSRISHQSCLCRSTYTKDQPRAPITLTPSS